MVSIGLISLDGIEFGWKYRLYEIEVIFDFDTDQDTLKIPVDSYILKSKIDQYQVYPSLYKCLVHVCLPSRF